MTISYETLINNLDEALLLFDKRGRLLFLNKAAEEFFGRGLKEVRNRPFTTLFSDTPELISLIQKTLDEGRSLNGREVEVAIGRPVIVDLNLAPYYVGGNLEGAILCLREHPELSEREDFQFDTLLFLIGSIAHEIKNPLCGIRGAAQLLKGRSADPESAECASLIVRETDRLDRVLQGYLTMAKRPIFNQVNMHEIIEHCLKVMAPSLREKGINIQKSYDPSLPAVSGDESKLLQVFVNLIKNAIEAHETAEGRKAIIIATRPSNEYMVIYEQQGPDRHRTAKKKQRWVAVTVQDNGPGIVKEDLAKIFLPFFTKKATGSGLGLALSKKIIRDHGGVIRVKSAPGQGTTFTIYLPYENL